MVASHQKEPELPGVSTDPHLRKTVALAFVFPGFRATPGQSAVVVQVIQEDPVVGGEARTGVQAVQTPS